MEKIEGGQLGSRQVVRAGQAQARRDQVAGSWKLDTQRWASELLAASLGGNWETQKDVLCRSALVHYSNPHQNKNQMLKDKCSAVSWSYILKHVT